MHGLIRCQTVTDAARHDGGQLREGPIARTNTARPVWADSAYRSTENEAWLEAQGMVSRIHRSEAGAPLTGWMAAAPGIAMCRIGVLSQTRRGSPPWRDYRHRHRPRQERLPDPRRPGGQYGRAAPEAAARPGTGLLRGLSALPRRPGSPRRGALPGPRTDRPGPRRPDHAVLRHERSPGAFA